jgi:hypothetical protein
VSFFARVKIFKSLGICPINFLGGGGGRRGVDVHSYKRTMYLVIHTVHFRLNKNFVCLFFSSCLWRVGPMATVYLHYLEDL